MLIVNNDLSAVERNWLEVMLSNDFLYRTELIEQINHAEIVREYTKYYLSLKFKVSRAVSATGCNTRIPVEMRIYKSGCVPIQFLLHIVDGYISELEIFSADSSEIKQNLEIGNSRKEFVFDESVKVI